MGRWKRGLKEGGGGRFSAQRLGGYFALRNSGTSTFPRNERRGSFAEHILARLLTTWKG